MLTLGAFQSSLFWLVSVWRFHRSILLQRDVEFTSAIGLCLVKHFFLYLLLVDQKPFVVFVLFCRPSKNSLQLSTVPDGSPTKDRRSSVGWGDCQIRTEVGEIVRFEPGRLGKLPDSKLGFARLEPGIARCQIRTRDCQIRIRELPASNPGSARFEPGMPDSNPGLPDSNPGTDMFEPEMPDSNPGKRNTICFPALLYLEHLTSMFE